MIHGDSGDIYSGQWLNDKSHGKGAYYHANSGAIYEGNWISDKQHGFGKEQWPDGTTYAGDFHLGMKHGSGKIIMILPNGEYFTYEGGFHQNMFHGQGAYYYPFSSKKLSYTG